MKWMVKFGVNLGLTKIGYGRNWGYRLTAGEKVCRCCAGKGKYTDSKENNMQNYRLVKIRRKHPLHATSKPISSSEAKKP